VISNHGGGNGAMILAGDGGTRRWRKGKGNLWRGKVRDGDGRLKEKGRWRWWRVDLRGVREVRLMRRR
jgi:hypothetical protein